MIDLDLSISDASWHQISDITGIVQKALHAAEIVGQKSGEVSVLLTDDAEMQRLNKQFRAKDKPTDVLSFPADPMDAPFLGDIAIGFQIMSRDAQTAGKSLSNHLSHLVIHGYLHLLGFDHIEDAEAEEMEGLERRALASMGIADPYSAT